MTPAASAHHPRQPQGALVGRHNPTLSTDMGERVLPAEPGGSAVDRQAPTPGLRTSIQLGQSVKAGQHGDGEVMNIPHMNAFPSTAQRGWGGIIGSEDVDVDALPDEVIAKLRALRAAAAAAEAEAMVISLQPHLPRLLLD
eukprot:361377-Chlamydomonas_euryale.AAC.10